MFSSLVLKMYSQKSELFFCEHSIAAIRSLICPLSNCCRSSFLFFLFFSSTVHLDGGGACDDLFFVRGGSFLMLSLSLSLSDLIQRNLMTNNSAM